MFLSLIHCAFVGIVNFLPVLFDPVSGYFYLRFVFSPSPLPCFRTFCTMDRFLIRKIPTPATPKERESSSNSSSTSNGCAGTSGISVCNVENETLRNESRLTKPKNIEQKTTNNEGKTLRFELILNY